MPSTLIKRLGVYTAGLLLGLTAILGMLAWLMGTEPALRWSVRQAERMSDGRLALHGVYGSLYGPLRIETISFQTGVERYEAHGVNLDWEPRALLDRHIQVGRLAVQELRVLGIKPSPEPIRQPASLHFPLTLSAPDIAVDRVLIDVDASEYMLSAIDIGVEKSDKGYRFALRNFDSVWGKGEAEIMLDATHPFNISASATMQQTADLAYRAVASASGSLEQVLLRVKVDTRGARAVIDANLALFEASIVAGAQIEATGINPAQFREGLPEANLDAEIAVTNPWTDDMEGRIMLRNEQPGSLDRARWPLREMSGAFNATRGNATRGGLDLRGVHLDLAGAGDFKGGGQTEDGRLQLDLSTANFDPRGLHSKMQSMRLAGNIRLNADTLSQALSADLAHRHFEMHLDARHHDDLVEIREGIIRSGGSNLALHGMLRLSGANPFRLEAELRKFNPADFGDYPAAGVNASFSGSGHLAKGPEATLKFSINDSHFRGNSLTGQGHLSISGKRLWDSEAWLQVAHNRLELKGALGRPDDRLTFRIGADDLAMLDPELGGKLHASGAAEGSFAAPSGHFEAEANDVSWRKDYRMANFQASGRMDGGVDGLLALDANIQGLDMPQLHVGQAGFNARGTSIEHTLQFTAKNPDLDLESRFAGGWRGYAGWSGRVTELSNRGRHEFALTSPAELEVAAGRFSVRDARVEAAGASLVLHELTYNAGELASSGNLHDFPLAYLQDFTDPPVDLENDLTFSGDWQFAVNDRINGHIRLWRERGDAYLPGALRTPLGLQRVALNVDVSNNQAQGRLEAAGAALGILEADARVMLSRRNGVWGVAGDAPFDVNAGLAIQSLAWVSPLVDRNGALTFDGAIEAEIHAGGTFVQPALAGSMSGDRVTVALPDQGLRFTEGNFQATLRDQEVHLASLSMRGGNGTLKGQGAMTFKDEAPSMQLSLEADKLEVLSRPDRQLILSGNGSVASTGKKLKATARLTTDRGLIELPKSYAREPSADVIVLDEPEDAAKKNLPYVLSFDLNLDLGERFYVRGEGLDAQFGGVIVLTSVDGAFPSSSGNIRVIKGAYTFYGQRLEIERGILNFQGPLDNPGIDFLASRKNQPVEVGVAVTGTAQSPRVNLVSTPDVPPSEKLSWLVLGHGLENTSGQDVNALQAAGNALLGYGESVTLQQRIAYATGLEDISLKGTGELAGTVLILGKRLSSRAYLSYEQGLSGASSLIKVSYMLSKRLSVQAQTGTAPATDLFYTFSFD